MAANARKDIVREGEIGTYHVWSRCVQHAFLCGQDPLTGQDFDYRREWIEKLLMYQARFFAVDVGNYTILSNHKHAILRTRPDLVETWTDEEVAWRWKCAWPTWQDDDWIREPSDEEIELLLADAKKIQWIRGSLSSLSWFMARWKEPIARLANAEMNTSGHYWEARFGSRELEGDAATLTCSLYVDLNQSKAGMADSFEMAHYSGIQRRIEAWSAGQVRESLEHFGEQARADQQLDEDLMRALLRDCFLAPIQADGPLMTATSLTSRETDPGDQDPHDEEEADRSAAPPASQPATQTVSEKTRSRRRSRPREKPSTKVHRRLKSRLRSRASDNLFLCMSIEEYFRVAAWALAKWKAQRREEDAAEPPGPGLPQLLADRLPNPKNWYPAIDQFQDWFFRYVGSAADLMDRAKSAGRRWLHGIHRCREQFG